MTRGRAGRLLRVGALSTQLGTSYLWQSVLGRFRSLDEHDRALLETHVRNAVRLLEGSNELRGAFTKLVQMMSLRADLFPPQALAVLAASRSEAEPLPWPAIRGVIESELGRPVGEAFRRIEDEPVAAASLSQVHRAELPGGERVVVKVQYPGVAETLAHDLANLRMLLEAMGRFANDLFRKSFDAGEIAGELESRLREELDYRREARWLQRFGELFADDEEVEVPVVVPRLSTGRVLTMTELGGYALEEVLAPGVDRELKDWVAEKLGRIVCRQVLSFGVLHADPHPGNYRLLHHPRLGILDFGSVREFPDEVRLAYLEFARALLDGGKRALVPAARKLGLLGAEDRGDSLVEILKTLFEPLMVDRAFAPSEYRSLERGVEAAKIALADRAPGRSPAHAVFLVRTLLGLEFYWQQLGTVANWHRILAVEVERAARPRRAGRRRRKR